jgi:ArsR family transcriptional regulator
MHDLARPFKALADSNRLRILNLLSEKPLCVCEITSVLGFAVSTVSKHLSVLRDAGFITDKKDAKWVNYSLTSEADTPLTSDLLALIRQRLHNDPQFKEDRRKVRTVDRNRLCGIESSYVVPKKS